MMRKVVKRARRLTSSVPPAGLRAALDQVMSDRADILLVHSSLSACGHFSAGAEDVVAALRERTNTICLPTHTYCYPVALGQLGPIFDPARTPSQNGVLTEIFRKQPGVARSVNATHSLAAAGPLSETLIAGHEALDAPCGKNSPWHRLVERRASVLLFGVSFHAYTPYHTAEDVAESPFAYEPGTIDRLRYVDREGRVQERRSRRQSWTPRRFREVGDFMERVGLVKGVVLGRGRLLFVPDSAKIHDFLVGRLRKTPDFLYLNSSAPLQ